MNCIGVDLGGTRIKIGLISDGELLACKIIDADSKSGLRNRLPIIKTEVNLLLQQTGLSNVWAMGVAFPGLVDTDKNIIIGTSGKYEDAASIDLAQWGKQELGMTVKLENDARMASLGEWKYGVGKGYTDVVMCTLGTGIGTSAIINGKILRGKHYQAGVLGGHSIIDYSNKTHLCSCGNYGCVESIASTWVMKNAGKENVLFERSLLKDAQQTDMATIFELAALGDELAINLQNHCLAVWGIGLVNLIHAYDPEVVIIGGGISKSHDLLTASFTQIIKERAWTPWGLPEVKIAEHPDTAALLGTPLLFTEENEPTRLRSASSPNA